MAKKETKKVNVAPEIKAANEMVEVVIEKQEPLKKETAKKGWEVKDRLYYLKGRQKPISYLMKSANVYWFDPEKQVQRELKYCKNQQTCFVDEMKGDQRLSHIVFRDGSLFVPKEEVILQKLLSLYHPHKDKLFYEYKPAVEAQSQIDVLELEADAIVTARSLDIDMVEAIMRVEKGSEVSKMSSKELKRDLLVFARTNPNLFLELASDDNVQLRNFGIKAVEEGVIKLSSDQRNFMWGSNDRKIMTVPFDEHPYTALAHWFKTDEGMEIYSNIEKRFNA